MAARLPKFVVIKSAATRGYAYYMTENDEVRGRVSCEGKSVFSPVAEIEVEAAKLVGNFVHLRFYHSNKHWAPRDDGLLVAISDKPEEDISKLPCTLFKPSFSSDGKHLYLIHVQSGERVRTDSSLAYVDDHNEGDEFIGYAVTFVDWDTLVKIPERVTFKGDNSKFLKGEWYDDLPYLQFSSDDGNEEYAAYEVQLNPDGYVRVKSVHFGKFWRLSPNWIWADSSDESGGDTNTLFWPVKVDGRTIALRNAANNNFCIRLSADNKEDCLNAAVSNITVEAKLEMEELVLERNIYDVRYRMEDARIYDEKPFLAGIGTATNESDTESSSPVKVAYEDSRSYSFSNTFSVMTGVKTTIKTGLPSIVEGQIEVSAELTCSLEWDRTTQEKKIAEATYTVKVPAKSRARVNYVGTQGRCSVPFSYTQKDKSSNDGQFVTSQHVDGIFNDVNYYSFRFEQLAIEPLIS